MAAQQQEQLRQTINNLVAEEQNRLSVQLQMLKLTEKCWDACIKDPTVTRLTSRDQHCLENCVWRFFDSQVYVRDRMFGKI